MLQALAWLAGAVVGGCRLVGYLSLMHGEAAEVGEPKEALCMGKERVLEQLAGACRSMLCMAGKLVHAKERAMHDVSRAIC